MRKMPDLILQHAQDKQLFFCTMVFSYRLPRCPRGDTTQEIEKRNIFHGLEYLQPI